MSTYTIGEIADASGFSASALRYYEGIGLVAPAARSAAGYRLYDDGALVRLAFIARAKRLGCTLDEITDLVAVWDGTCEPLQKRFHDLVTTKLAETQRQVAELTALHVQLRDAADQLAGPALDGTCDGDCACIRAGTHGAAPIACTIASEEIPGRVKTIERMRANLERVERTERGLVLHFPARPDIEADLRRFAVDEKRCCEFWGFDIITTDGLSFRWDGPPSAAGVVDRLESYFRGDEPALDLAGLL